MKVQILISVQFFLISYIYVIYYYVLKGLKVEDVTMNIARFLSPNQLCNGLLFLLNNVYLGNYYRLIFNPD